MNSFSMRLATMGTCLWIAGIGVAHSEHYQGLVAEDSTVSFSYRQMGVTMQGQFRELGGILEFDTQDPEAAQASIAIKLGSVSTGIHDADTEILRRPWFHVDAFPTAHFQSSAIRPLGDDRYEVDGVISIKGVSQPVTMAAQFTPQGDTGVFEGNFTLLRNEFGIGEGAWSSPDVVGHEVQVQFRMTAPRAAQ